MFTVFIVYVRPKPSQSSQCRSDPQPCIAPSLMDSASSSFTFATIHTSSDRSKPSQRGSMGAPPPGHSAAGIPCYAHQKNSAYCPRCRGRREHTLPGSIVLAHISLAGWSKVKRRGSAFLGRQTAADEGDKGCRSESAERGHTLNAHIMVSTGYGQPDRTNLQLRSFT